MPLQYLQRIAETPAPTFQEAARAGLMVQLWRGLGYQPWQDETGNVLVRVEPLAPAARSRPPLMLAAHLDTVFEAGTDVRVRQESQRWYGPGLGDNSSSLAVLTALLRDLDPARLQAPLLLAADVGEEGLGDLRGAKSLLQRHAPELGAFIAVDGYLGHVVTHAVGVRRYRAEFAGPGGHSWGRPVPSAVHALGRAITGLYALPLPAEPRTTLNVGLAEGGSSVNAIAAQAALLLDLRSMGGPELEALDKDAVRVLHAAAWEAGVGVQLHQVSQRPGGSLHAGPLLPLVQEAGRAVGIALQLAASSTDANAAVPYGLPALTCGVYRGGHAHRLDEWVDPYSHAQGLAFLRHVAEGYAGRI